MTKAESATCPHPDLVYDSLTVALALVLPCECSFWDWAGHERAISFVLSFNNALRLPTNTPKLAQKLLSPSTVPDHPAGSQFPIDSPLNPSTPLTYSVSTELNRPSSERTVKDEATTP
ncbi:hypothetical protein BLNAU_24416 [Blattamonas nauphoetae]|uniref:Uncharacterized protein n=1 Tax=Blattamonas nauphoetae TaxID=2049346 RepID=A0ABQ9WMG4_9EUKA|nr:hypothetical protein BLNAU_24416 [Blattamonas nauphoetae]